MQPIRLHEIDPEAAAARRLNLFPGRHLGEREFDLLQAYADDRLSPLMGATAPGVLAGLTLEVIGTVADRRVRVQPGSALAADGRVVRLLAPLDQTWGQLRDQVERESDQPLRDGFYLLTLHPGVELADADAEQDPCRRAEPDPLRDRRLETVALLGLAFLTAEPGLLAMDRNRAANRLCVRFLEEPPLTSAAGVRALGGGVPLALVKVGSGVPVWIDGVAGRFEALPDASYRTFLAHTWSVLAEFSRQRLLAPGGPGGAKGLADLLGIDFLPAAGALPAALLRGPGDAQPQLAFDPRDLQVELMPVPASTVPGVVERELPRGVVDLVHGAGDRVRLLLAIADPEYGPRLLDQPRVDPDLEAELAERSAAAIAAHQEWKARWLALFNGLTPDQDNGVQAPPLPADEARYLADKTPRSYLDLLVARREKALPADQPLPEPYAGWKAKPRFPKQTPVPTVSADPGLYARRETLRGQIEALQGELEEGYRLLNEINDHQGLQRRHLDAVTVSFSALAGGTPGDGSGITPMRWANYAVFKPQEPAE